MPDVSVSAANTAPSADWRNDPSLNEKWKFRFDFFEKYGVPGMGPANAKLKEGFKSLSFGQRVKVNMNFFAFFFSFIYFGLFLKMWRQALIAIGIIVVANIIVALVPLPGLDRGLAMGLGVVFGQRANALYYLKRTQGDIGWKFF